jgi:hypothetical protein
MLRIRETALRLGEDRAKGLVIHRPAGSHDHEKFRILGQRLEREPLVVVLEGIESGDRGANRGRRAVLRTAP